ncbi:MAG: ABC transporter ATP-binding protein [Phenylobacterium sp.]|uniref:dipeptide ABC transporter ATP-binding protein n=1 Tax=Phenylobacterium sp. TaxID=1871053 RepID=UPI0027368582|nr:ABC transporter ATP-binding protein [Phenylobacterium sp.]MDP3746560.1 ABC transporter ATP-binding protein [Phenylobacterium sp.]
MTDAISSIRPVLAVDRLSIAVGAKRQRRVVDEVSFSMGSGEIVGLVGESGSGKTMIGRALLRLLPPAAAVVDGQVTFDGVQLSSLNDAQMRGLRGRRIGAVFQEPMASLNPAITVGAQITEGLILHDGLTPADARRQALRMLEKVKIADPDDIFQAYPHQCSGGMRQRIMLASVLALRPALLIADEPTTALDALIRKEVMDLMAALASEIGTAVLLISHDLAMVAQYADKVVVLRGGRVVEQGPTSDILLRPQAEYTRALIAALPARDTAAAGAPPAKAALVEIENLCVDFKRRGLGFGRAARRVRAVEDATLDIRRGEVLAVVGESGSGKTTIGRALLRLCGTAAGAMRFAGSDVGELQGRALADYRGRTQMVFQDPFSSLDPRMKLGELVAEPLRRTGVSRDERQARARQVLEEVGLAGDYAERYPHELSGGQRQRVCIARAVISRPEFIVADEPVSALDVTVQHQVLGLLAQLQRTYGFSYLFISHDLGVVEQIADRVVVMYRGRILELGSRDAIYDRPQHPYTQRLLEATPRIVRRAAGGFELTLPRPTRIDPPAGYAFFNHGSMPGAALSQGEPVMVEIAAGHSVCCMAR